MVAVAKGSIIAIYMQTALITSVTSSSPNVNLYYSNAPKMTTEKNEEQKECIKTYTDRYNLNELNGKSGVMTMNITATNTEDLQKNLERLKEIEELDANWNENGATKFSTSLITKVGNLLCLLKEQPEIFPTAMNSIQLEYEKEDGQYLEINVYENHTNIFSIDSNEQEKEFEVKEDEVEKIKKIVEDFHEKQ